MASHQALVFPTRFLLVLITIFCFMECVSCVEFQAGERTGWVVPPSNQTQFYNEWASRKRFKVGDTIRFKYRKDSVMEVNKTDYTECNSNRPNFFSNNGETVYTLDRSGFFYFISGATGHCDKGQRMIVWVLVQDKDSTSTSTSSASSSLFYVANKNSAVFIFIIWMIFVFQFV